MIFAYIETLADKITASITEEAVKPQVDQLGLILVVWFTLYVMAKGYMVLAGKSDEPVKDLLFRLSMYAIIVTFATNAGGWLTLVTDSINGLHLWASGDVSLYERLDKMLTQVLKMGAIMEDTDGTFEFTGFFCQVAVLISFTLVAIPAIGIIIVADFTLKILIMISPLMIFALLFGWFKGIFGKWVQLVLNNTLTVLFVGVFFNILSNEYKTIIDKSLVHSESGSIGIVPITTDLFFTSLIILILVLLARALAKELTYVSIESLPGSAAKSGGGGLNSIRRGGENMRADVRATRDRWRRK
jgi:type IV secretion system protein VirB6